MGDTEIGDSFTFSPECLSGEYQDGHYKAPTVTGTVVQIHAEHAWFRVRYPLGDLGAVAFECIKIHGDPEDITDSRGYHRGPNPNPRRYKRSFDGGKRGLGQVYKNT